MLIANPIYDSVFKYLMDDHKVAKLLLSKITGMEIIELESRPQEFSGSATASEKTWTVYRLDFSAKVKMADGAERLIIIEIQKAKLPSDIMRFRKYLGSQYISENNSVIRQDVHGNTRREAIEIISIYFLGYHLEHVTAPVIKIARQHLDMVTGNVIDADELFIKCLVHESYIIQIPYLSQKRQCELLNFLSVFDQSIREPGRPGAVPHILDIDAESLPAEMQPLIRRLQKAQVDPDLSNSMDIEDDVLRDMQDMERRAENAERLIDEANQRAEEERRQKEEALREKDAALKALESMLPLLVSSGMSESDARKKLGLK